MKKWKCSVCGYIEKGETPPEKCPVCGADKSKFKPVGEEIDPDAVDGQNAKPDSAVAQPWKCTVCGYIESAGKPSSKCPVCGADRIKFLAETPEPASAGEEPLGKDDGSAGAGSEPDSQWQCSVCGYIHVGAEPPERCPVCGADRSKFILLGTSAETDTKESRDQERAAAKKRNGFVLYAQRAQILTRLHGHPIAVHIPNGVLPLSVLLTLLAFLFQSESMAVAAKLNMIFICLSMPAVLVSGLIDWYNRFEGRMTNVFKVKMVCGTLVTILTFIISVWWILAPEVYQAGFASGGLFLLLNLVDLVAAATAGFYGGKLVFHD